MTELRIYRDMPERVLAESVARVCEQLDLLHYHTHRSDRSPAGWPDEALISGDWIYFLELKKFGGRRSPEQRVWIERLQQVRHVAAGFVEPPDWPDWRDRIIAASAAGGKER